MVELIFIILYQTSSAQNTSLNPNQSITFVTTYKTYYKCTCIYNEIEDHYNNNNNNWCLYSAIPEMIIAL